MHLVGILFPHINDDARSKSHQILVHFYKKNELKPKIAKGITNLSTAYYALLPLQKSQSKLRAESWTLNKDSAKQFTALKEKFVEQCLCKLNKMKTGESNIIQN